jgi:plastocyanin
MKDGVADRLVPVNTEGECPRAPHRRGRSFWHLGTLISALWASGSWATSPSAAEVEVELSGLAYPELLTINQGDTVSFVWNSPPPGLTESYTGEWRSPILHSGDSFQYTFQKSGTYVYRTGFTNGGPFFPGVIKVQALHGAYPSIWIGRPFDKFIVPGFTVVQAFTTNSPISVRSVDFFADGEFVGRSTNSPYQVAIDFSFKPGTYEITANLVSPGGTTNTSAPISITFDAQQLFQPWRLAQGQTALFMSAAGGPWCILWSDDLRTWNSPVAGQLRGNFVFVDETTTNTIHRFYRLQNCL